MLNIRLLEVLLCRSIVIVDEQYGKIIAFVSRGSRSVVVGYGTNAEADLRYLVFCKRVRAIHWSARMSRIIY